MIYRVYIIENQAGKIYIGVSENIENRLLQHNAGESKWTAKFGPWTLNWNSYLMSLGDARKVENKMKRQKGGNGLRTLMDVYSKKLGS